MTLAAQDLYSAKQVAERLGLHVRTVRNYVRDQRLKAVRIGKQYRIAREDLETMVGGPLPASAEERVAPAHHVEASCIVMVESINPETAIRLTNAVIASANSRDQRTEPLRIDTIYDQSRERLKIIVTGGLVSSANLLTLINHCVEAYR